MEINDLLTEWYEFFKDIRYDKDMTYEEHKDRLDSFCKHINEAAIDKKDMLTFIELGCYLGKE